MIRVLVIKPNGVEEKKVKNDYKAFKEEIEISSPIDCVTRSIGGVNYDIWCDDEGLLNDNLEAVAFNNDWNEILVGNIMIANSKDGEATSLTDEDIERIERNLFVIGKSKTYVYHTSIGDLDVNMKEGHLVLSYGQAR